MINPEDPEGQLILVLLRYEMGWDQGQLARAARIAPSLVSLYESGKRAVPREALERAADAAEFARSLLPVARRSLRSFRAAARGRWRARGALRDRFFAELLDLCQSAVETVLQGRDPREREAQVRRKPPVASDREGATDLWARLARRTPDQRQALLEEDEDFRNWAVCELAAAASIEAAAEDPRQALELAHLALRIAELIPGEPAWRRRNEGYAWFHIANAERACGALHAAGTALTKAGQLWEEGASGDPGLLDEAKVRWIEATLRGYQGRFAEALVRLKEALAADRTGLEPRILLTKARILGAREELQESTAVLREVEPNIDAEQEPRLALGVRFELLVNLCLQDRAAEAAPGLPSVRALAEKVGKRFDLLRTDWLEAKVAAGLGRAAEAQAVFERVRQEFTAEEMAYDCALVSLDLALVLLAEGRTAEVRTWPRRWPGSSAAKACTWRPWPLSSSSATRPCETPPRSS